MFNFWSGMKPFHTKFTLFFVLMSLLAVGGVYNLSRRPALPAEIQKKGTQILVTPWEPQIGAGHFPKELFAIEKYPVHSLEQVKEIYCRHRIGEKIELQFRDGSHWNPQLISANDLWYLLVNALLGFCALLISFLVWQRKLNEGEKYFSLSALFLGYILAVNWGFVQPPLFISLPVILTYYLCYPQTFSLFLIFSEYFPSPRLSPAQLRRKKSFFLAAGALFSAGLIFFFLKKTFAFSVKNIRQFIVFFNLFRIFLLFSLITAIYNILRNLRTNPNPVNRRKVQWLLGGIFWGSFPFVFLWTVPHIFNIQPLIPEWLATLFLLIMPASIAVAILRHRFFDIEFVFSRSLVYSTLLIILVGIYLFTISGLSFLIFKEFSLQYRTPAFSIAAALLIALMFNPLKDRIQTFVNKKFFRIKYDRFQSLQNFMGELESCLKAETVADLLMKKFQASVPVAGQLLIFRKGDNWFAYRHSPDSQPPSQDWLNQHFPEIPQEVQVNKDFENRVEAEQHLTKASLKKPWILLVPVGEAGIWLVAEKRSGSRFWKEDLDLASQLARSASLQIEKLRYFESALQESVEREKAEKMNEWKSLLVAQVAHDLRAPLNTMLWRLKNLQRTFNDAGGSLDTKFLEVEDQIFNLQHLIQNLLILSQKEYGKLAVKLQLVPFLPQIEQGLKTVQGILSEKKIKPEINCPPGLTILSDPLLLREIFLNILQNSAKFSPPGGKIFVDAKQIKQGEEGAGLIKISFRDQAGGIASEILSNIFTPFSQSDEKQQKQSGFHLGLYIVKEFIGILNGEIQISSEPGKGTTIILTLPAAK